MRVLTKPVSLQDGNLTSYHPQELPVTVRRHGYWEGGIFQQLCNTLVTVSSVETQVLYRYCTGNSSRTLCVRYKTSYILLQSTWLPPSFQLSSSRASFQIIFPASFRPAKLFMRIFLSILHINPYAIINPGQ